MVKREPITVLEIFAQKKEQAHAEKVRLEYVQKSQELQKLEEIKHTRECVVDLLSGFNFDDNLMNGDLNVLLGGGNTLRISIYHQPVTKVDLDGKLIWTVEIKARRSDKIWPMRSNLVNFAENLSDYLMA